ncbi:MAG: hypothetical protein WB760_06345 [Xanthobacteraceae bacterium]
MSDGALCERTRAVIDGVDWPCEVLRNYADANMGCGKRVSSGLDWAFAQVDEAIILEDDCLPDPSFFPFCDELLERYRGDDRVMMISGDNFQNGALRTSDSYYFSRIPHCWGWATWRRAWRRYDFNMTGWPQRRQARWLKPIARHLALERDWTASFDNTMSGNIDTWDYQWMYCMFVHGGLSVAPNVNLITNIGLGAGTHTEITYDERFDVGRRAMEFPLLHPAAVTPCEKADDFERNYIYLYRLSPLSDRIRLGLRSLLRPLRPCLEPIGLWSALRALAIKLRV